MSEWHSRHIYGTTSHQNSPFGTPATAHLQVARGTNEDPAEVWMHHTRPTGVNHVHSIRLYNTGRAEVYADVKHHDIIPANAEAIRALSESHHTDTSGAAWMPLLDAIVEHPQIGPLMSAAVDAHTKARVS